MTINIHGDIAKNYAANVRLVEATGSGSLLFTEDTENSHEYFSDYEVIYYKNLDDLMVKISYFLVHEKSAEEIATRGYLKTSRDHTYDSRAAELLPVLLEALFGKG